MLKINNINKSFHDKKILNSLSLNITEGEIVVLIGNSGEGKSTLLRILAKLETPDSGSFSLNEKSLSHKTINKNHLIGMVFQGFNLFEHMTVLRNITFVIEKVEKEGKKEAQKKALKLLIQYGLEELKDAYPANLSGGQKQRLSIARTLALNPKIVCFDEPTSALDPSLTKMVAENIKALKQKKLIILVATHDMSLLKKLPATICLMKKGKIIETCKSENFELNPQKYPLIKTFIKGA